MHPNLYVLYRNMGESSEFPKSWTFYPLVFFKKANGILLSPLSVRLSYLLLNHWKKFNQIWCVSYSHEWGTLRQFFLAWGPGEGSKCQISFNFNYKVNFKDLYTKLCVCTHKWKIQNISDGIFNLLPGSCPRGGLWGCFKSVLLSVRYSISS